MTIEINHALSAEQTVIENQRSGWYDPRIDINLVRRPDRFIHIYTVSKREFKVERPPLHPAVKIPACGPNDRYKLVLHVPDPFTQAVQNMDNGRLRGEAHDGLRVAIDLINPNNITNNLDWECPDEFQGLVSTGYGCDLSSQGVFMSFSNPPSEEEIKKAETKRHKYYERLRRDIETSKDSDVKIKVQQNGDYDLMADYFGIEYPWHRIMAAVVACPNCQEKIPMGAAWHVSGGIHCINDWKKAVDAGIKKKDDVPESKRWWEWPRTSKVFRGCGVSRAVA